MRLRCEFPTFLKQFLSLPQDEAATARVFVKIMKAAEAEYQVKKISLFSRLRPVWMLLRPLLSAHYSLCFPRWPSTRITRPCRTLPSKPYAASFLWRAPRSTGTRSWATKLARRCRMLRSNREEQTTPPQTTPPPRPLPDNIAWLDSCFVFVKKYKNRDKERFGSHMNASVIDV